MKYFIGIDSGASKTEFALLDESGKIAGRCELSGSSYRELGVGAVSSILKQGVDQITIGLDRSDILGVCYGMSCYGEHPEEDQRAARQIENELALPMRFENDVACAWAGSLAFQNGIMMLAGTGSMAWGRDINGVMHRCGGWSNFFSDEGSGYWLGRRTLELFYKQSDGRAERGPLYKIVREYFSVTNDIDLLGILDDQYLSSRKKVASLQKLLFSAAHEGDITALMLYDEAAKELALMIKALRNRIELLPGSPVSYAGGLWRAGETLLGPFRRELADTDMIFIDPLLTPAHGALLFAVDRFDPASLGRIRQTFLNQK